VQDNGQRITPGHMGTRRCQSKMAIERDLGQSGRTASVDPTDARNTTPSSEPSRWFQHRCEATLRGQVYDNDPSPRAR
jgi:hypothetical protein